MRHLYVISTPIYLEKNLVKIGYTTNLRARRATYLTGCPPGQEPSADLQYYGIWQVCDIPGKPDNWYERCVHDEFRMFRIFRNYPKDSEWFQFPAGENALQMIGNYLDSRKWVHGRGDVHEMNQIGPLGATWFKVYRDNTEAFIWDRQERIAYLEEHFQKPAIQKLKEFLSSEQKCGYMIAPCGAGKTRMTVQSLNGFQKIMIVVPSCDLQRQWKKELLRTGAFDENEILYEGGLAQTAPYQRIQERYCLIVTNASSKKVIPHLDILEPQLTIFDEAHHMAGVVSEKEDGEGVSRAFFSEIKNREKIKLLSLTFTPRIVRNEYGTLENYLTMDDENDFGRCVHEISLRTMINAGVLPDYNIWVLRDGNCSKTEKLLHAWSQYQEDGEYFLHHLVIFAETNESAREIEKELAERLDRGTSIYRVSGDEHTQWEREGILRQFEEASRAILVNCRVLGEGVDLPSANAVAIMYPKHVMGETVQMIFRAGRWHEGKSVFHLLLPMGQEENWKDISGTLSALASVDTKLRDEIMMKAPTSLGGTAHGISEPNDTVNNEWIEQGDLIHVNICPGWDETGIYQLFHEVAKDLFPGHERERIRKICQQLKITDSFEYKKRCKEMNWPDDPRFIQMSWYDFLHPAVSERYNMEEWRAKCNQSEIYNSMQYENWKSDDMPTMQEIMDGYFGEIKTFSELMNFPVINQTETRHFRRR